ncbi:MAG: hypothetical protein ACJAVI_003241 [Candidatus Azotimanducaceae bacterium]|jgi:hypothetical protein
MKKFDCAITKTYDQEAVKQQQSRWNLVLGISDLLKTQAAEDNWNVVVVLADQRDTLVKDFFSEALCDELYDSVLAGVAQMEAEHEKLIAKLNAQRLHVDEQEKELLALKDAALKAIDDKTNKIH